MHRRTLVGGDLQASERGVMEGSVVHFCKRMGRPLALEECLTPSVSRRPAVLCDRADAAPLPPQQQHAIATYVDEKHIACSQASALSLPSQPSPCVGDVGLFTGRQQGHDLLSLGMYTAARWGPASEEGFKHSGGNPVFRPCVMIHTCTGAAEGATRRERLAVRGTRGKGEHHCLVPTLSMA